MEALGRCSSLFAIRSPILSVRSCATTESGSVTMLDECGTVVVVTPDYSALARRSAGTQALGSDGIVYGQVCWRGRGDRGYAGGVYCH